MKRLSHQPQRTRSHTRAGYLYIAVLITTTLVAVIGLAASSIARVELRTASRSGDLVQAQALARTAVEEALRQIDDDPNWRSTFSSGVESPNPEEPVGSGTIAFQLVDPDGNLSDDESDSVRVIGIGRVGSVTAVESVRLYPTGTPLTCLETAICCNGDIVPASGVGITTNQMISSNGSIDATAAGARIDGNAEAVGSIQGAVTKAQTSGVTARVLPGSDVFEYYKDNGTWIDVSAIPSGTIDNVVLSPASNPFGSQSNVEGIYVISCGGENLVIRDSRIVGTLVVLNPGPASYTGGALRWDTVSPNYPALLANADFDLRHSQADLDEAAHQVNFNPIGTAYDGEADSDLTDTYPAGIRGLVFIDGNSDNSTGGGQPVNGALIAGSLTVNTNCDVDYRSTFLNYPPPGFAAGNPMRISPGSWKRDSLSK